MITPITQRTYVDLEVMSNGIKFNYSHLPRKTPTKILGLNINNWSFTATHVSIISKNADNIVSMLYSLIGLDFQSKLLLVKALIIPTLTYPCVPLNTSSIK